MIKRKKKKMKEPNRRIEQLGRKERPAKKQCPTSDTTTKSSRQMRP